MFQIQARDVPTMRSYEDAVYTYNTIKPARDGYRYLSRNRSLWMEKGSDGDYHCCYHHNKVVTFRSDNTVTLRSCGWNTLSTARFVGACTGLRCFTHRGELYVSATYNGQPGHFLMNGAKIDMNTCTILNPTQEQRRVLDKAASKEVRALYMPAFTPIINMAKFMDLLPNVENAGLRYANFDRLATFIYAAMNGDEKAKELVTNMVLARAVFMRVTAIEPNAKPVEIVRRVVSSIMHEAYKYHDAITTENVPLGELPPRSRY